MNQYASMTDELKKIAQGNLLGRAYRAIRTGIKGGAKVTGAAWKTEAKKKAKGQAGKALAKQDQQIIRVEHVTKKPLISTLGAGMVGAGLGMGGLAMGGSALIKRQLDIHTGRRRGPTPPYTEG